MNRVPVIVRNPAYVEELEPDKEVDQADSPIITVPASEDKDVVEDASEDDEEDVPHILRGAIQNLEGLNQELRSILSDLDSILLSPMLMYGTQGRL